MPGADEVVKNLGDWDQRLKAALYALAENAATSMEAYAKNPPFPIRPLRRDERDPVTGQRGTWVPHGKGPYKWRTGFGDARRGLFGSVQETQSAIIARISHTEQHGISLELEHQGRYGVLKRSRDHVTPEFLRQVENLLWRVR